MKNKLFQQAKEQIPEETRIFVRKYTDIIDRIHELMEEKGYNQKELAEAMGKRESEISKWLNNEHNLTLRTLAKLEKVLEGSIIEIPSNREKGQFVGWKKTCVADMHMYVSDMPLPEAEDFEPAYSANRITEQTAAAS